MKENYHQQQIPAEVLTRVQAMISEAIEMLSPYMLALTPADRRELPKMGEKTISFVEKAHEFAKQNPNLRPSYLDMGGFSIDFADARSLWALLNSVHQLESSLDDTEMVAGSEAYQAALVFYQSVKMAAGQNVPGAKAIYEELKTRFPNYGRPKTKQISEE
ncbi:MAG: hypothetical protein LBM75_11405 [Myxococcales bacterium]|jgi:hypothetical protein|nr:hypothetical protein [Myxococcales bacterium]